ncbi:MAG: type II toxin-antitoxin system RatA family toxin [Hyphomonadaceae bacterium]
MGIYNKTVTVRHSPDEMFELVADIKRYPDFVRWIKSLRLKEEREEEGVHHCLAQTMIGFKGFTEFFSTRVSADKTNRQIIVDLERGPFRKLHNKWTMTPTETGGTNVSFHIDYAFSNPVLRVLAAANFDLAVDRIMKSFLDEADRRYGRDQAS